MFPLCFRNTITYFLDFVGCSNEKEYDLDLNEMKYGVDGHEDTG